MPVGVKPDQRARRPPAGHVAAGKICPLVPGVPGGRSTPGSRLRSPRQLGQADVDQRSWQMAVVGPRRHRATLQRARPAQATMARASASAYGVNDMVGTSGSGSPTGYRARARAAPGLVAVQARPMWLVPKFSGSGTYREGSFVGGVRCPVTAPRSRDRGAVAVCRRQRPELVGGVGSAAPVKSTGHRQQMAE